MYKLKRKCFNSPMFLNAVHTLCQQPLPVKTSWNIMRTLKQCQKAEKELKEEVQKIVKKHLKVEPVTKQPIPIKVDDQIVPGQYETLEPGGMDKFNEEYNALFDQEVDIESFKVNLEDIKDVKLSANNLQELEPIFECP